MFHDRAPALRMGTEKWVLGPCAKTATDNDNGDEVVGARPKVGEMIGARSDM